MKDERSTNFAQRLFIVHHSSFIASNASLAFFSCVFHAAIDRLRDRADCPVAQRHARADDRWRARSRTAGRAAVASSWFPVASASSRFPVASSRFPVAGSRFPVSSYRFHWQPATGNRQLVDHLARFRADCESVESHAAAEAAATERNRAAAPERADAKLDTGNA